MTSTEPSTRQQPRTKDSRSAATTSSRSRALTVGMLETALGRDDGARRFLLEADELGIRFGNRSLTSSARTQLAILDVRAGDLDTAKAPPPRLPRRDRQRPGGDDHRLLHAHRLRRARHSRGESPRGGHRARRRQGAARPRRPGSPGRSPAAARPRCGTASPSSSSLSAMRDAHELGAELRAHDALALVRLGVA